MGGAASRRFLFREGPRLPRCIPHFIPGPYSSLPPFGVVGAIAGPHCLWVGMRQQIRNKINYENMFNTIDIRRLLPIMNIGS